MDMVQTGSGPYLQQLIRLGYVDLLLAGHALATHDIEQAMFGTSLGAYLDREGLADAGHGHHLRAINRSGGSEEFNRQSCPASGAPNDKGRSR